eukprot:4095016-Prymnesium_polylepis.2
MVCKKNEFPKSYKEILRCEVTGIAIPRPVSRMVRHYVRKGGWGGARSEGQATSLATGTTKAVVPPPPPQRGSVRRKRRTRQTASSAR